MVFPAFADGVGGYFPSAVGRDFSDGKWSTGISRLGVNERFERSEQ